MGSVLTIKIATYKKKNYFCYHGKGEAVCCSQKSLCKTPLTCYFQTPRPFESVDYQFPRRQVAGMKFWCQ